MSNFTSQIYGMFCDIDKSASELMQEYQTNKNKETSAKYKKDVKSLLNQKTKYISELMKNLAFIGLSYRRGNLQYALDTQNETKKAFIFKPCVLSSFGLDNKCAPLHELQTLFVQADFDYYLCVDRFFAFKEMLSSKSQTMTKELQQIPVEKFSGFIEHLFQIVFSQKEQLHEFLNQLNSLNVLSETCGFIVAAESFNVSNKQVYQQIQAFCVHNFDLIKQVELFFDKTSVSSVEVVGLTASREITSSYSGIKEQLVKQKSYLLNSSLLEISQNFHALGELQTNDLNALNQDFKFAFADKVINEHLLKLKEVFQENGEIGKDMVALDQTASTTCRPLKSLFDKLSSDLADLNRRLSESSGESMSETDEADSKGIQDCAEKAVFKILKSIEIIYKKLNSEPEEAVDRDLFGAKSRFLNESYVNFKLDIQTFDLVNINEVVKSSLTLLEQMMTGGSCVKLETLQQIYCSLTLFCQLYSSFLNKWASYLIDNHKQSCKCFYALLYIFSELKTKGFSLPDDFDSTEANEEENRNPDKKFELDDTTPAGLADDGEGQKDVSDQIENEDQLDDTKLKSELDKEEEDESNNKEDKPPVKENEKGIEMSEDFEGDMEDAEEQTEQEKEAQSDKDEDDVDEMADLEDQKGSVEDDEQVLDEKLWDEEGGPDNDEEDEEELDTLDEDNNSNKKQNDIKQELASKSEDLSVNEQTGKDQEDAANEKDINENDENEENREQDEQKSHKINELSDEEESGEPNENEDNNNEETKPDVEARGDDEPVKEEETDKDDIEMQDQSGLDEEQKEGDEEGDEPDQDKEPLENAKKEKEDDLPDEENDETEPKNSNVDSKENKAIPNTDLNNQNQLDKQNNSKTDENNSINTNEQNEQENSENNEMNSLCDKISSTNEGFNF